MWQPGPYNSLADCQTPTNRVLVGHAHDQEAKTGTTVIQFEQAAVTSVSILGQAPGTRETELLDPSRTVQGVDAVVLSGGSAFGLTAADSVIAILAGQGRGFAVGEARVPIVPGAILFDLTNGGSKPADLGELYRKLGREAVEHTADHNMCGAAGAGFGASTGAPKGQDRGGLGTASAVFGENAPYDLAGYTVAALVAVNAVGSPYLSGGEHFRAAPFEQGSEFGGRGLPNKAALDSEALHMKTISQPGENTTIGCVVTTASLSKAGCRSLAIAGQDGITQAIYPAHTSLDGDLVFGSSVGSGEPLVDPAALSVLQAAATATMARAIARGVYHASKA